MMRSALRVELLKITTTRMWWILLLVMVLYIGMVAAFLTFSFSVVPDDAVATGAPSLDDRTTVLAAYTLGLPLGYVFPVVLGVLVMTTEYRYQTITPTFLGDPNRARVLLAKLLVTFAVGLLFGVLGLAASVAGAAPIVALTDHAVLFGDSQLWRSLGQACVAMALWAGIGVGLGAILRNQVAAIVVILAFSQLVEPLARLGLNAWSATRDIAQFLPGAAADAMAGASLYSLNAPGDLLRWWQGGLVMAAYAALFCVLGWFAVRRRDVA
ncbi:MAG TPA: ABC transporter permease [Pseudonocardiaceae bacterium]